MVKRKFKYYFCSAVASIAALAVGIMAKENWLAIIASVVSAIYTIQLAGGERYAFLFGSLFSVLYAIVSFLSGLYATAVFMIIYLLPVTIISFIRWGKVESIYREPVNLMGWLFNLVIGCIVFVIAYFILKNIGDSQPIIDSVVFALSVMTGFWMLTSRNEFWIINTLACGMQIVMWMIQYIKMGTGLNIIILQSISTFFSIIGLMNWVSVLRQRSKDVKSEVQKTGE